MAKQPVTKTTELGSEGCHSPQAPCPGRGPGAGEEEGLAHAELSPVGNGQGGVVTGTVKPPVQRCPHRQGIRPPPSGRPLRVEEPCPPVHSRGQGAATGAAATLLLARCTDPAATPSRDEGPGRPPKTASAWQA